MLRAMNPGRPQRLPRKHNAFEGGLNVMNRSITKLLLVSFFVLLAAGHAYSQNGTNGIYGGYVGSDRWFTEMRQSPANQAMLRNIAGVRSAQQLPADYVEFAGQIVFPHGKNPFPRGRFPDLRIRA